MQQVLVLNASYEPLNVTTVRRAHVLVFKGKAEVIEELEEPLRSATDTYPRPHVIRLVQYVRVPRTLQRKISRRALFARDGWRCAYCGETRGRPRRCPRQSQPLSPSRGSAGRSRRTARRLSPDARSPSRASARSAAYLTRHSSASASTKNGRPRARRSQRRATRCAAFWRPCGKQESRRQTCRLRTSLSTRARRLRARLTDSARARRSRRRCTTCRVRERSSTRRSPQAPATPRALRSAVRTRRPLRSR